MEEDAFIALCKLVESTGFPISGMNIYCPPEIIIAGPGYDADVARKYAQTAAKRGHALGARIIGIGAPRSRNIPDGYDRNLARKQLVEFLRITAGEFAAVGINAGMEALGPCFCNFINTVSEAYEVVSEADVENLMVLVDLYNMELSGEADIELLKFVDRIGHAHTSDDDGSHTLRSYLKPDKYPLHEKRIRRLKETGYNGSLTIETDIAFDSARAQECIQFLRSI